MKLSMSILKNILRLVRRRRWAQRAALVLVVAAGGAPLLRAQQLRFGFEGCPAEITGQAGEVKTFDVFTTLSVSGNALPDGVQAWQTSLTAAGGAIKAITLQDIQVSTIFDQDGNPATPPLSPHAFNLTDASFKSAQLATHPIDGRKGAVSAVELGQDLKTVLQPNGVFRLARITVEVTIPDASRKDVTLKFEDGFRGTGQPIQNKAILDGIVYRPQLGSCTVSVEPLPVFAFGLEGCPGVVTGHPGELKTFDVFATLSTSHNASADGVSAWSLGVSATGGRIKAIAVGGVSVPTIFDSDGEPATPPLNPYSLDLANASFQNSQLATRPSDGRKGAVSAVVLGQDLKTVLQPNGTARLARITVEVSIPTGDVPGSLVLRFENGLKGTGQPVPNRVNLEGTNYNPSLLSCTTVVSPLPTLALGFEGCPSEVHGQPGEVKTFDVFATLTTGTNPGQDGASAWQVRLTADGGKVKAIAVDGVMVSTIFDSDSNPSTPPATPFQFDLGTSDFKLAQLATNPGDGRKGAVSAIILAQDVKAVLQPNETARIARVTVEVTIPAAATEQPVTLHFENGFKGTGQPVKNLVNIKGQNFEPFLGSCTTVVSSLPAVSLAFEGCPGTVSGKAGEVKTFDVVATLTTLNNPADVGPSAWQVSLTAAGGSIKAIALKGVQASTVFDHDADDATPPVDPSPLDLADAAFQVAQLATNPADSRKGAVSAVVLATDRLRALHANGTASIARITVEAAIPAGADSQVVLRFEDGFKGSGQPVKNIATIDGVNFRPGLGSCTVQLHVLSPSVNQIPGDCNQDGTLDISDAVCLLGFLFTGQTPRLPCGDGSAADPANLSLMNANGDAGGVDLSDSIYLLSYLFLGGPPHVLGSPSVCAAIAGCPSKCQ